MHFLNFRTFIDEYAFPLRKNCITASIVNYILDTQLENNPIGLIKIKTPWLLEIIK